MTKYRNLQLVSSQLTSNFVVPYLVVESQPAATSKQILDWIHANHKGVRVSNWLRIGYLVQPKSQIWRPVCKETESEGICVSIELNLKLWQWTFPCSLHSRSLISDCYIFNSATLSSLSDCHHQQRSHRMDIGNDTNQRTANESVNEIPQRNQVIIISKSRSLLNREYNVARFIKQLHSKCKRTIKNVHTQKMWNTNRLQCKRRQRPKGYRESIST